MCKALHCSSSSPFPTVKINSGIRNFNVIFSLVLFSFDYSDNRGFNIRTVATSWLSCEKLYVNGTRSVSSLKVILLHFVRKYSGCNVITNNTWFLLTASKLPLYLPLTYCMNSHLQSIGSISHDRTRNDSRSSVVSMSFKIVVDIVG